MHWKKWDFLESFDFGSILTSCILGKVTARQNHLHLAKRFQRGRYLEIDQSEIKIACGGHIC